MRLFLSAFIVIAFQIGLFSQMTITEIMYNPPESGQDSLEFIELYNNSGGALDLTGYTFDEGVEFTFPQFLIEPEGYVVICVDTSVMERVLGITEAFQFESGALSNGGEDIILLDAQGNTVDVVDYDNGGDWPIDANGEGSSLELCDPNRDNSEASNWKASESGKGVVINGREVKATPGEENQVSCADHTVMVFSNFFDPDTITINVGETVEWISVEGIHNVNGSLTTFPNNPEGFISGAPEPAPWSYNFTFTEEGAYDYRCDPHFLIGMTGHIIVENNQPPNLVITEIMYNDPGSDSLEFVEIFNNSDVPVSMEGLRVVNAISHEFGQIMLPEQSYIVLARDKNTVDDAFGIDAIQWDDGQLNNSGEAIEIIDRVGNSIDRVEYNSGAPWDTRANGEGRSLILCDVLSDNSSASNWSVSDNASGVQVNGEEILANPGAEDVCEDVAETYPRRSIASVTTVDIGGLSDSIGIKCALQGIVHGVDLQSGDDIQFTIIDQSGGIGVYGDQDFNYTVTEGDELLLKGTIAQFSGLTQIEPDSLRVISTGNALFQPQTITQLDETTESELILIDAELTLVNAGEWDASGSSFNVNVTDGQNLYNVRIDDDTDIAGMPVPTDPFRLFGIGGQFDTSDPYTSGYQILPRYFDDFDFSVNVMDERLVDLHVVPNPVNNVITIQPQLYNFDLFLTDLSGRTVMKGEGNEMNVAMLKNGIYILEIRSDRGSVFHKVIKK